MRTILVSTIPRSGTWAFKYFLHFLAHYAEHGPDASFEIHDIFARATDSANVSYLAHAGVSQIRTDHFTFPGFGEQRQDWPHRDALIRLKRRLMFEEFDQAQNAILRGYEPLHWPQQRCILIHRNIFEHFHSMLDGYRDTKQMTAESRARAKLRNWPVENSIFIDLASDAPPLAYFARMIAQRTVDCYALYLLSFKSAQMVYGPDRVGFFRYEDMVANPQAFFCELVAYLGIEAAPEAVDAAVRAVAKPRMQDYEAALGRPLSGEDLRDSHMTRRTHLPWRAYVTPELARAVKARLALFDIADIAWREEDDALL